MGVNHELACVIDALDFQVQKLHMASQDHEGWDMEKLDYVEKQYKRYLYLWAVFPEKRIVPTHDIDIFWHKHIVNTRNYHDDCQKVFGYYKHHRLYPGDMPEGERAKRAQEFEATKALYEEAFGEPIYYIERA